MSVAQTSATVASGCFTILAILAGIIALYQWAIYALVWTTAWDLTTAVMWTIITAILLAPVAILNRVVGGA